MQTPSKPQPAPTIQRTDYSEIFTNAQNLRQNQTVQYDRDVSQQLVAKALLEVQGVIKSSGSTEYETLFRLLLAKALLSAMLQFSPLNEAQQTKALALLQNQDQIFGRLKR